MATVVRPIVRSFVERFASRAAAHARAGGHSLVFPALGARRATLVFRAPRGRDEDDLGWWALMDIGKSRYKVETSGPYKGLATSPIPRDCIDIVKGWVERDSVFPGPTREMELDCLACGACCRDNEVILEDEDLDRFARAGRRDLARKPWAKKDDGRVVLVLRRDKGCKHLADDNKCGIYEIRPNACSQFPMGSECCLFSRADELGIVDRPDDGGAAGDAGGPRLYA